MNTDTHPARKTGPASLFWSAGTIGGGVLKITDRRADATYVVVELPVADDFDGRAFRLQKLPGAVGTDPEAANYDVFCSRTGAHQCECKGFLRWGGCCKHLAAMLSILANEWI